MTYDGHEEYRWKLEEEREREMSQRFYKVQYPGSSIPSEKKFYSEEEARQSVMIPGFKNWSEYEKNGYKIIKVDVAETDRLINYYKNLRS